MAHQVEVRIGGRRSGAGVWRGHARVYDTEARTDAPAGATRGPVGLDLHPGKALNPDCPMPRRRTMDPAEPLRADAADPEARAPAIRRRLMARVADTDVSHLTIAADQGDWQPFMAGVAIKVLHEQAGVLSYLLRLEPGAVLPPHRHPQDEECVVLEGRLRVGSGVQVGPGGYHRAHRGALHATITTDTGATIFLRGAVPDASQVLG